MRRSLLTQYLDVAFSESPDGVGGPYCSFVLVLELCFGNGTTETPALLSTISLILVSLKLHPCTHVVYSIKCIDLADRCMIKL